jgi:pilus assembly protein CpaC
MTKSGNMKQWAGAVTGAVLGLAFVSPAAAQATGGVAAGVATSSSGVGHARSIDLPAGKSASVELPVDARDVIVTNPAVADVVLRSARNISVLGLRQGTTDAVFFDAAGRRILSLDVNVDLDATSVSETINRLMPGAHVHAEGLNGQIVLTGQVASASEADQAVQLARTAVAKPELVIDMLSIGGKDQVMLKVRIVEVQRNIIKQLGFNLQAAATIAGSKFSLLQNSACCKIQPTPSTAASWAALPAPTTTPTTIREIVSIRPKPPSRPSSVSALCEPWPSRI